VKNYSQKTRHSSGESATKEEREKILELLEQSDFTLKSDLIYGGHAIESCLKNDKRGVVWMFGSKTSIHNFFHDKKMKLSHFQNEKGSSFKVFELSKDEVTLDLYGQVYKKIFEKNLEHRLIDGVFLIAEKMMEISYKDLIEEKRLEYTGSIVLGLNDALVEMTGALAGLTLALQNTRLIALSGLVTGIAAASDIACW